MRVDPSTLGLNIEIPIAYYPGRAGAGLPITLNYSSKLWRMKFVGGGDDNAPYTTRVAPAWGEHTAAGWTSTLGPPKLVDDLQEIYSGMGFPTSDCGVNGCWVVRKVTVQMPDGSSHVLRHTSPTAGVTVSRSGTYTATDGSGLRYEYDSKTLHLPDGSRHVLGHLNWPVTPTTYTDRNGNTLSYDPSTNLWTDTLGRDIAPPPMPASPGDYPYTIPGVGDGSMTYTFKWRALADALTDTSQGLAYYGDCDGLNFVPPIPPGPALFSSTSLEKVCANPGATFNPAVLAEIVLPNGASYKFTYNLYGEIEKVVYPTGGYERFRYDFMQPVDWVNGVYVQANRGVVDHYISAVGSVSDEVRWRYAAGNWDYTQPYKVVITAPDDTYTERYLYAADSAAASAPWGFNDARFGRAYDERSFSAAGQMMRRTLTRWVASPQGSSQGTYPHAREPRPDKKVEILLDTGTDAALTKTTTHEYDGDLNIIATTHHDFYTVSQNTGQSGSIGSILEGAPLRTDETTYLVNDPNIDHGTRAAYRGRNLIRLPSSTRVRDAGDIVRGRTEVRYDEAGFPLLTYAAVTGWVDPQTTARGNPTTSRRWLDTAGTWPETHTQYDQCGNVRKAWDAGDVTLANPSQVDYTDSFSDEVARNTYAYPTVVTTAAPNPTPVPKPSPESGDFDPGTFGSVIGLTSTAVYDFETGLVISSTNPNDKVTFYDYTDPLNRLKRVDLPDGGRTTYNYVDAHQCGRYVETRTLLDASGRELASRQFLDGLGRPYLSETFENQDPANPYLRVDTVYDSLGRVSRVSNPYRSSGCTQQANPSGRWTETAYDALGRVKTVTTPDGAKVYTLYDGERVLVTDQARKQRVSKTDALGRLTEVWEVRPTDSATGTESVSFPIPEELSPAVPPVSAGYKTGYTYDVLGNLRKVEQGAQQRFFMYDSLGRLTRARNPEQATNASLAVADPVTQNGQWAVAYGYDANGNLTSRTDARGVTTTYTYDRLNRNLLTRYAGGATATPDVRRYYDKPGTEFNGLGRLWRTETVNLSATVIDGYDPAGRPKQQTQKFWKGGDWEQARAYGTSYEYNVAGGLTRHTYPSGHEVIYNYDAAGRIGDNGSHPAFKGTLGDAAERTYASHLTYSEFGGLQQERFGTQTPLYHKRHYNRRGQLFDIRLSTAPWATDQWNWNRGAILNYYSGNYAWEGDPATPAGADNNGNLRRQQHWVPADDQISSHAFTQQTYEYDALNRLAWVAEAPGANGTVGPDSLKQAYDYDRWGNRTIKAGETWLGEPTAPPSDLVNEKQFDRGDLQHTNRLYAPGDTATQDMGQRRMRYDAAGNLIYDDYTGKGARTYDAENQMTAAADESGGTASYAYDADGRRVKRLAGGAGEVWQVYGAGGELLAEYANDAPHTSPRKEYGYRGGELLVTAEPASAGGWDPPSFSGPDPLSPGDPIKLQNLTELRSAVNQLRQHAGLAPYAFTVDPNPESNVTTVKAEHIRQLRAALEAARSQLGLSIGGYTHPTLTENSSLIYAIDFQELREQVRGAWQSGTGGVDLRWLVPDHLGTPRMVVDRTGSLAAVTRHDYFPFGEEVGGNLVGRTPAQGYFRADGTRQEFTGYERDNETGLDFAQARYFASAQGRFTSPDEFFNDTTPVSPQRWNLYAYVNNNPLNAIDPTGMRTDFIDQDGNRTRIDDGRDQVIYAHSRVVEAMEDYHSTNVLLYSWHLGQMQESPSNLRMTTGEFDKLAGVIYAEASNRATPGEAAAIHGVLRNRARDDNNTVLDQAMDTSQVFGAREAERGKIFDKFASVPKRQAVYLGIAMSVVTGNDLSKGAYFWHGVDFKKPTPGSHAHERFYLVGFQFTSKSHDIWNLGDHKSSNPRAPYVYQSTAAHGQTTFMRLTETWKQAHGAKTWRGK